MGSTRWRGAVVVVALLMSAGCWWGQPGAGPGNTFSNYEGRLTVDNVGTLRQVWSGRGGLSAVVSGKVVGAHWTASGVEVVAHDLGTGAEAWSRILTPPGVVDGHPTHPPIVTGDAVWAGYQARTAVDTCAFGLSRLDLADGSLLGTDTSAAPAEMVPFADKVALVTQTYFMGYDGCWPNHTLTQRLADGATGTTEWTSGRYATQAITVVGDTMYAFGSELSSYPAAGCGAATCAPTWQTQPAGVGALYDLAGESTGPLVATASGPELGQLSLHAIDPATGTSLGSTRLAFNASSLALAGGTVFVAGDATLAAYDVSSCAAGSCVMEWSRTLGGRATWSNALAVAGGVVYVGREDGVVESFAAEGCGTAPCPLGSVSVDGGVMQLAVSQGRLLVGTLDTVTAFAPAD